MSNVRQPNTRLFKDRISPRMTDTLWGLIKKAQADDALAPVTVIGPTRYANLALRQQLGWTGFANVRFIVLSQLSELLGSGVLSMSRPPESARRPLARVLESVAVRKVLEGGSRRLQPVRSHPATQDRVRASFRQLRLLHPTVLNALERRGGLRTDIVRMYRTFRSETGNDFYDSHDLAEAAAAAVTSGRAHALADLGLVILYLPGRTTPSELKLVQALARQGKCAVIIGTTDDDTADQCLNELESSLIAVSGTPESDSPPPSPLLPGQARIHVAPTAREEIRRVLRGIMQEARENRTPFHRMAVLYRVREPYAPLIHYELTQTKIPIAGPGIQLLRDSVPGKTLMGLLRLAGGELLRADVMAWLTGCPVRLPPNAIPSAWDSLSRRAGIVGGFSQWSNRLDGYARSQEEKVARLLSENETSESRSRVLRNDASAARVLRNFMEDLRAQLEPPAEGSNWESFSEWARKLLDHYLDRNAIDDDDSALDKVRRALDELKAADALNPATTMAEFRQAVHEALQDSSGPLGPTGRGVFVSGLAGAQGMNFDVVWIVGMIEGAVPPPIPPDPLVPEADWIAAGAPSRIERHVADERRAYLAAVASAPRRVLSYPVAGASSGRRAYPSRWLLEQASVLEESPVHSDDLPRLADRPWLTIDASPRHALSNLSADSALADLHDYSLHRYLHWKQAGNSVPQHPLTAGSPLDRAAILNERRSVAALTDFDGNLSHVARNARFARPSDEAPISPTRLEAWATCPFSYFLGHILHLSALETPEDILSISALERGGLMHKILERFINESRPHPSPMEPWSEDDHARLKSIADQEFAEAERRGVTGKLLLWEMAKEEILADLETFLEEDGKLRAAHDSANIAAEIEFDTGTSPPTLYGADFPFRFRGIIDRVDTSRDGKLVLVIDYKTGSSGSYSALNKDPIDRGKRLQLPVYSLAARKQFPNAERVRAAYWFPTTRGGYRLLPKEHFNLDDPRTLERFNQGVSVISQGIRGGLFPANPGPPDWRKYANCTYCDFDAICPSRRADAWDLKKKDPALTSYVDLAENDPAEKEVE